MALRDLFCEVCTLFIVGSKLISLMFSIVAFGTEICLLSHDGYSSVASKIHLPRKTFMGIIFAVAQQKNRTDTVRQI